jgi:DNA-binding transcriptional regulator YdaS (Cro superfamily)
MKTKPKPKKSAGLRKVDAVQRAVTACGGQSALAEKLTEIAGRHIRQGHVWGWLMGRKRVTSEPALWIEEATRLSDDPVTAEELCPSFPWESARRKRRAA